MILFWCAFSYVEKGFSLWSHVYVIYLLNWTLSTHFVSAHRSSDQSKTYESTKKKQNKNVVEQKFSESVFLFFFFFFCCSNRNGEIKWDLKFYVKWDEIRFLHQWARNIFKVWRKWDILLGQLKMKETIFFWGGFETFDLL